MINLSPESYEKKKKYNMAYNKEHMKRIPLDVQISKYEEIKKCADAMHESVNGYIKKSIEMRMNAEGFQSE